MGQTNPFSPGFGQQPPFMAGRGPLTTRFWTAAESGPRDNDYAMVLVGIRGSGKTAFMGSVRNTAQHRGWGVVRVTATGDGSLDGAIRERALLTEARPRRLFGTRRWVPMPPPLLRRGRRRVRGVQVAGFGAEWDPTSQVTLSETLRRLGRTASRKGRAVLLTVDEMHQATEMERRRLSVCLQEIAEEELPVAFLGAGLAELAELVDDQEGLTFFQRCGRASIGLLSPDDARQALEDPVIRSGKVIDDGALDEAVDFAQGYPFKIQLIGSHAWKSVGDGNRITRGIVRGAAHEANLAMLTQVVLPLWTHLSGHQQNIVAAMTTDSDWSRAGDVADRTGVAEDDIRHQLRRLEILGVVERRSSDECRFLHPLMGDWLRGEVVWPTASHAAGAPRSFPSDRSLFPAPVKTAKQRILDAYATSPQASNAELARRAESSRSYVGKVLREAGLR